jgi:hypothetical protein
VQSGLGRDHQGQGRAPKSERERGYIEAAAKLYTDGATVDQRTRVVAYEKAMAALGGRRIRRIAKPSIFWALVAHGLGVADGQDLRESAQGRRDSGEALSRAARPSQALRTTSFTATTCRRLPTAPVAAAHRYSTIAPSAPHALHMPSHTFTRVGAWQDSIDTNLASAAAARKNNARAEELHAMDYMAYAYLQTGQDPRPQDFDGRHS